MTMRVPRLLPIAAVLIVATAGAVLLLGGNTDPAPPGPVAEPDERVQSTAPAADPATADSALGWPDDGDPMASDELPAEIREAVAKADPSQAPRIRVVRGNPPVAAADVEVLFTTTTAARERLGAALPRRRLEWPELCGARVVTDADGIAQLPLTQEVWLAIARAPAEFAFAFVPPGDRIVTLALQADEQILVTVADDDGRPLAAAPVEILQHEIGAREARVVWGGATDANGEALVRHFQFVRRRGRAAADERFAAAPTGRGAAHRPPRRGAADTGRGDAHGGDRDERETAVSGAAALARAQRAEAGRRRARAFRLGRGRRATAARGAVRRRTQGPRR